MEKEAIRVEVFRIGYGYTDNLDLSVGEFIDWVNEKVAAVPAEHRDSVRIYTQEQEVGDYGHAVDLVAAYDRLETDAELADRQSKDDYWAKMQQYREVNELQRLIAKYNLKVVPNG